MKKSDLTLQTALLLIFFTASVAAACKYSIAVLESGKINQHLVSALNADLISYDNFHKIGSYDCLVITDSRKLSDLQQKRLLNALKNGMDLILLGGDDISLPQQIPVFERRDVYYYRNASSVILYSEQNIIESDFNLKGNFNGISAIGFEYPEVSRYIPLLTVKDDFGRNVGFAAGLLVNYAGQFKNSNWLLFGIDSKDFYKADKFINFTADVIKIMEANTLANQIKKEDESDENKYLLLTSPAPADFLKLSNDKKHFILPNGKKFFALGCNYVGSFERKTEYGQKYYNLKRLEQDFQKARDAGINAFRFWNFRIDQYPQRLKTIIELARKYQIYLLLQPREHPFPTDKQQIELFQRNASVVSGETIVLGYDLMNEPYITMVGSTSVNGRKTEILQHKVYEKYSDKYFDKKWVEYVYENPGWPELGKWINGKDAKNLYAAYSMFKNYTEKFTPAFDYSCLYGLNGKLPVEPEYADFIAAVDKTFADWILFHKRCIEQFDKNHFITVGYNTSLAALPCNNLLDFVSHHIYQMPYSYEDLNKSATTFDRLRKLWPDKPITLGEFGFSSGLTMPDGKYLGYDAASVAEMIIYLYAFANDYSGAYLWMLSEWPLANIRYNAPWISDERQVYESQFGMYYYDGTAKGCPKPIAHAVRFFRQYVDTHNPGDGKLDIIRADTPMKTGYVFSDADALFVGNTSYVSKPLKFQSSQPVNVMLMWDSRQLKIMATCDVEAELDMTEYGFVKNTAWTLAGLCASFEKIGENVKIKLLKGNIITLTGKKEQ